MDNKKMIRSLIGNGLIALSMTACTPLRTPETERLLANLLALPEQSVLFGHHDDTVYGIGWEDEEGRSDVKSVCGDYPAVISFDIGEIELGGYASLDRVSFDKIRREVVNQFVRGGMSSLSWHVRNPLTGGDAWDVSDRNTVRSILPGGAMHEKFVGWLDRVSTFISSLSTPDGVKIPVIFRPWHEHTGSWFWWGKDLCTADEYVQLWQITVARLRINGVNNVLYAYSSGADPKSVSEYLERYPGDELIDVVGFDTYQFERQPFVDNLNRMLTIVDSVATDRRKVPALTEVGYESVPDSTWWTGTLLPALQPHRVAYALVWRNARERITHYYAPYPGQASAADFVRFHALPETLFAGDVKLYD
jgi:mannan endo-1,4-beta-mannosidase